MASSLARAAACLPGVEGIGARGGASSSGHHLAVAPSGRLPLWVRHRSDVSAPPPTGSAHGIVPAALGAFAAGKLAEPSAGQAVADMRHRTTSEDEKSRPMRTALVVGLYCILHCLAYI